MANQEIIDQHLARLIRLRDEWTDEIPTQEIHNQGNYKIRTGWESAVNSASAVVRKIGLLSPEGERAYMEFLAYRSSKPKVDYQRSKIDIDAGNKVLNALIKDLQCKGHAN
jgi:hypothetical protein